jgi:hypothetical protein
LKYLSPSGRPYLLDMKKPEQIAGHDSASIIAETKKTREIASTHRVYRKEWLFDSRHRDVATAKEEASRYEGRLHDDDIRFDTDNDTGECVVWTRRWNVAGEWKWSAHAEKHATALRKAGAEVEIVARNSRQEHRLRNYGVLKLV